jgi:hypothetical protein
VDRSRVPACLPAPGGDDVLTGQSAATATTAASPPPAIIDVGSSGNGNGPSSIQSVAQPAPASPDPGAPDAGDLGRADPTAAAAPLTAEPLADFSDDMADPGADSLAVVDDDDGVPDS